MGDIVAVVDVDEVLDLLARNSLLVAHEPIVNGRFGQLVEQIAHARLIGRMNRAEIEQRAIVDQVSRAQIFGPDHDFALFVGEFGRRDISLRSPGGADPRETSGGPR